MKMFIILCQLRVILELRLKKCCLAIYKIYKFEDRKKLLTKIESYHENSIILKKYYLK